MSSTKYIIVTNRVVNPLVDRADITNKEDFTVNKLKSYGKLDFIFIPFWSWYIPPEIYKKWTCIVFHMTDLPFGRGGSPLQNLIVRGFRKTKISAIKVTKGIDAGPIYCKVPLSFESELRTLLTADEIYDKADEIIRNAMIPFIIKQRPEPSQQKGSVVYFPRWKCSKDDIKKAISSEYEWNES